MISTRGEDLVQLDRVKEKNHLRNFINTLFFNLL